MLSCCHHGLLSNQQALNAFFGLRSSNSEWVWVNSWVPQSPHCPSWVCLKMGEHTWKNQRFEQGNIGFSVNPWILECLIFRHIMTVIMTYSAMNMAMNWTPMVPSRHQDGLSFLDSCLGSRQRELCFERFFKRKTTRTLDTQLELNGDELNRPYSIWILRDELNELTITYQLFWCSPKAPLFWPTANIPQIWGKNWTLVLELFFLTQNRDHKMMFSWVKLEWHPLTPADFRAKNHLQYGCPSRLP